MISDGMVTREQAIQVIKTVKDPELSIDLWTLGLIYDIKITREKIRVKMTLTTPFCPFGPQLVGELKTKLLGLGFKDAEVEIVFDPPWEPSEKLKEMLGMA